MTGTADGRKQSACVLEDQVLPASAKEPAEVKDILRKRQLNEKFTRTGKWEKVLSWNVNGARARIKDGSFLTMIKGYDVLCLTEFRCPRRTFLRKKDKNGSLMRDALEKQGFRFWAESVTKKGTKGSSGYAGVTVISKIPFACAEEGVGDYELDKEGRFLTIDFEGFYLAVSYFPNSGKKDELTQMDKRLRSTRWCVTKCGPLTNLSC